jgi:hypothetical protein
MIDKSAILQNFAKALYRFPNADIHVFFDYWMSLLKSYEEKPGFISFVPRTPLLTHLSPRATSLLIVKFDHKFCMRSRTSIIPLYLFRIRYEHADESCDQGFQVVLQYLRQTNISLVGFHPQVQDYFESKYIKILKREFPKITVYGSHSIDSFYYRSNSRAT